MPRPSATPSWVRGTNRYLPHDIAVQWSRFCRSFHSRASAVGRRYVYVLLESAVRPALETGLVGWTFRSLDGAAMREQRRTDRQPRLQRLPLGRVPGALAGEDDASVAIEQRGAYWRFSFDADAFLHHMIRNIVGSLVAVGSGVRSARGWPKCSRHATARWPPRPSRPTASTSWARTTIRSMRSPSEPRPWTGCSDVVAGARVRA